MEVGFCCAPLLVTRFVAAAANSLMLFNTAAAAVCHLQAAQYAAFTHRLGIRATDVCVTLLDRLQGDQARRQIAVLLANSPCYLWCTGSSWIPGILCF